MRNDESGGAGENCPDLLTADEVGQRLRLPRSTVYHLAKSGELPAVRFGRSWRFPADGIERLRGGAPGAQVLVVDDDPVTRALMVNLLGRVDCRVWEADSYHSALDCTSRQRFDVVFVDLRMPGPDGVELVRQLLPQYPLDRIVVMTAYLDEARTTALLELGPVTLLRKPLAGPQVIGCVERVLGRRLTPTRTATATAVGTPSPTLAPSH